MISRRYLLYFSYIGNEFWYILNINEIFKILTSIFLLRGAQRQIKRTIPSIDDPNTVQGRLEMGLKLLKPMKEPKVNLSSR